MESRNEIVAAIAAKVQQADELISKLAARVTEVEYAVQDVPRHDGGTDYDAAGNAYWRLNAAKNCCARNSPNPWETIQTQNGQTGNFLMERLAELMRDLEVLGEGRRKARAASSD